METLEQEFAWYKAQHKHEIIMACLIKCEKEGIYDEDLLSDYKYSYLTGKFRAFEVGDDLMKRLKEGEKELYDAIYEMCWNKMKRRISDKKSYRLKIKYNRG